MKTEQYNDGKLILGKHLDLSVTDKEYSMYYMKLFHIRELLKEYYMRYMSCSKELIKKK